MKDCCSFRVLLLNDLMVCPVNLTGIKGPHAHGEPFFEESRYFVEFRLLQRKVNVIVESMSNQFILGTFIHPAGNISEILVKEGFCLVADWSLPSYSLGSEKLREAENFARDKRVRQWKDAVARPVRTSQKEFEGLVTRIVNGESICVEINGVERKITFSSIRQPKSTKSDGNNVEVGWNFDAREYLRKKLVGQSVKVKIDYVKPASEGYEEKNCCTVLLNDK